MTLQDLEMRELIFNEVKNTLLSIRPEELDSLVDACVKARKIMVVGKGRVEISLKAFAMHLTSLGLDCCSMNEVTSFNMDSRDLLILGNLTGCATWANAYVDRAHELGAKAFYITVIDGEASNKADHVLHIPARAYGVSENINYPSVQPMCSTSEQCIMMALDAICLLIKNRDMQLLDALDNIIENLQRNFFAMDSAGLDNLVAEIEKAKAICFSGYGREGLVLSGFAMRVYHMGYKAFVAGETNAQPLNEGALLVLACGPGNSKIIEAQIAQAKTVGAKVALITANPNSELTSMANVVVHVSGAGNQTCEEAVHSECYSGVYFEQCEFVALDYAVYRMMQKNNWVETDLSCRHTNIQ